MTLPALEWRLARRYLRARTDNRFLSFIAAVGVAGIAIGVAVLLVVLAVMNGFEAELRERILTVSAHATLSGLDAPIEDWRALKAQVLAQPAVRAAAPYIEERALLVRAGKVSGVLLRGILPEEEAQVGELGRHLEGGTLAALADGGYRVLLGKALAAELGARIGDRVVLAAPRGVATPAGLAPRLRAFTVAGLVNSGLYEFDRNAAIIHLADAARVFRMQAGVTGLRLKLDDPFAAPRVVRAVAIALGGGFYVSDWTRQHANFFRSIATTKSIMFVLLLLVIAVAAFNIVATLVMLVREKQGDIAVLKTLGLAPRSLMLTFVMQGTTIGALGTCAGLAGGALLARHLTALVHGLERLLGTTLIDAKVYFIEDLPARVSLADAWQIGATAFALACLSTLYPAWRAARTEPAEVLRHV